MHKPAQKSCVHDSRSAPGCFQAAETGNVRCEHGVEEVRRSYPGAGSRIQEVISVRGRWSVTMVALCVAGILPFFSSAAQASTWQALPGGNIHYHAADLVDDSYGWVGGITEAKKIAAMADAHYMAIAPHCPLGPIALAACVHFALSTPNFLIQEHGSLGEGYLKNPLTVKDGHVYLPEGPGLGIEVDEKRVRAMPWKDWDTPRLFHEDGSVADW